MNQPGRPTSGVLTSWKEIATYFNREVRTVQLWEKEEGLPVHRHLHRRQASVYAYPAELETWWKQRGAAVLVQADLPGADAAKNESPGTSPDVLPAPREIEAAFAAPARSGPRWVWLALAAVVILVAWEILADRPQSPAAVTAYAAATTPLVAGSVILNGLAPGRAIGDLNGDGRQDFILTVEPSGMHAYVSFGREIASAPINFSESLDVTIRGSGRGGLTFNAAEINGDGIGDLMVAEYFNEPYSYSGTGQTYIFFGRKSWPRSLDLADADVTIRINAANDARLGPCTTWEGSSDFNGDGIGDLLLTASEYSEAGRRSAGGIFIFTGRREWPKKMEVVADSDIRFVGARTGEGFAGAACNTGDFNADGRTDLVVHASEATLWEMRGRLGRSYLFLGRHQWPRRVDAATDFDLRIDGHSAARESWLTLADINGDGADDLVLFHAKDKPELQAGEVLAWFGKSHRRGVISENTADLQIEMDWPLSPWGPSMQAADMDLDGLDDILLSSPVDGRVTLVYGRQEWKSSGKLGDYSPVLVFQGEPGTPHWRTWVRDMESDLLPELVVWSAMDSPAARQAMGWIVRPHHGLDLDVRPTHEPNILYLPEGVLVVRIKGKSRAVKDELDLTTVRLAGALPSEQVQKDYDGDGIEDLQIHFETSAMRVTPATTRVALTARTRSGLPAAGTDSVQVVVKRAAGHSSTGPSPD